MIPNVIYQGYRVRKRGTTGGPGYARVRVSGDGGTTWHPLRPRRDLRNASPTGFEWGYGGSGPAQTALAILAHALADDERALDLHQRFKFARVARFPREGFTITRTEVIASTVLIEIERAARRRQEGTDA
jgi:hypothetical protein